MLSNVGSALGLLFLLLMFVRHRNDGGPSRDREGADSRWWRTAFLVLLPITAAVFFRSHALPLPILLHLANCVLVYALAERLYSSREAPFWAAAIFALHGAHAEAIVRTNGLTTLYAAAVSLMGLLLLRRYLDRPRLGLLAAAIAICAVAAIMFAWRWNPPAGALRMWSVLWFPVDWTVPVGRAFALLMIAAAAAALSLAWTRASRRELLLPLGFTMLAALTGSRYLYLASAGFALLIAAARPPLAAGAVLLLVQFAALERNLGIWSEAASIAQRTCENAAALIDPGASEVTIAGVPLETPGLPECIAMHGQKAKVHMTPAGTPGANFVWDPERRALVRMLAPGVVEVTAEMRLPAGAHDYEIRGDPAGTVLKMSDRFQGRALFVADAGRHIRFTNFTIDGNRDALEQCSGLAPSNLPFARFTRNNGILLEGGEALEVSDVQFRNIAGFAILVSRARDVRIERVRVETSGSRNAKGRNNATGGILLEEGTDSFHVRQNVLADIRGNGIWTHSLYTSARNAAGEITGNQFRNIGRDAIQVGHATRIAVERNTGSRIGYPAEIVDVENQAIPVALDTAGNVDRSTYAGNRFQDINGKCIDLDGFHDGEIRGNTCVNSGNYAIVMNNTNPDMRPEKIRMVDNRIQGALYGGIFVIGTEHVIAHNWLLDLNQAHSGQELLQAGIYLGKGAERPAPARGNRIEDNRISGYGIRERCVVAAPGISPADNHAARNVCSD